MRIMGNFSLSTGKTPNYLVPPRCGGMHGRAASSYRRAVRYAFQRRRIGTSSYASGYWEVTI